MKFSWWNILIIIGLAYAILVRVKDHESLGTFNPKNKKWMYGFNFGLLCGVLIGSAALVFISLLE